MQNVWMWFSSAHLLFLDTWWDQIIIWENLRYCIEISMLLGRQYLIGENCNAHVLARLGDNFHRWEIHCSSQPPQKVFQVARILESIMCLSNMANLCLSAHINHYSPVSLSTEGGTSAKGSQAYSSGHPHLSQRIVSWQNIRSHWCFKNQRICLLLEGFVSVCTLYLHKKAGRNVDPVIGHVSLESCNKQRDMCEK